MFDFSAVCRKENREWDMEWKNRKSGKGGIPGKKSGKLKNKG